MTRPTSSRVRPRAVFALLATACAVAVLACGASTVGPGEECGSFYDGNGMWNENRCASGSACVGTVTSDSYTGTCVRSGAACTSDGDCPSGYACAVLAVTGGAFCTVDCRKSSCAIGYACTESGACEDRVGAACAIVDGSDRGGCGVESACSALTNTCTVRPPCGGTDDPSCGAYTCDAVVLPNGKVESLCELSCGECATGYACDADTSRCEYAIGRPCDPSATAGACGTGEVCSSESRTCTMPPGQAG